MMLPNIDAFWVKYLFSIGAFVVICVLVVLGTQLFHQRIGRRPFTLITLTTIGVMMAIYLTGTIFGWDVYQRIVNEHYWQLHELPARINQIWIQTFEHNGSPISINILLLLIGIVGVILRAIKRQLLIGNFRHLFTICILSVVTLFLGPYAGIDPDINTPRAVLYLSITLVFFSAYAIQELLARGHKILGTLIVSVLLLTSLPSALLLTKRDESVKVPITVIDLVEREYQKYPVGKILTDSNTMLEIVARSKTDLTSLLRTKPTTAETLMSVYGNDALSAAGVTMIISTPRLPWPKETISALTSLNPLNENTYSVYTLIQ